MSTFSLGGSFISASVKLSSTSVMQEKIPATQVANRSDMRSGAVPPAFLWTPRLPWGRGGLLRHADYYSLSYKNIPTDDGARRDHLWLLHNNISGVGDAKGHAQQITP